MEASSDREIKRFSIGQNVRVIDHNRAYVGEFGKVISVTSSGKAAVVHLPIHAKYVGVAIEQTILV
jgi:hypothetical protein